MSVRLSVRHTPVLSLNGYRYPQSFYHRRIAMHQSSIFHTKRDVNIPTGTPSRGRRMQGGIKNHDFRPMSGFISELMQDRAIVTMESE